MNKQKIAEALKWAFSIGLVLCMCLGLMITAALITAFIIGGSYAVSVCSVLKSTVLPILYIACNIIAFIGIVKMYVCGEKALTMDVPKKEKK